MKRETSTVREYILMTFRTVELSKLFFIIKTTDSDLLKYAISHGIIHLDNLESSMREEERKRLLSKHKYKIFQDKDGGWNKYYKK